MKYQVTAAEYADLDEGLQKLYGSENDGNHTIKIDGMPKVEDVSGLKAKVEQLLTEAKEAKKAKKVAEEEAAKKADEAAQKSGDVDAINESWQKKYDKLKAETTDQVTGLTDTLRHEKVHAKALELATTLAVKGSADVLMPHIEKRLSMEIKDGRADVIVMDNDGKPSALTVKELGEEIAGNGAFAPLIEASRAAGGGANGNQGGGAAQTKTVPKSTFDGWTPAQKMDFSVKGGQVTD
jgi:outer membrane murein-binding lipoprotein Lpp